MAQVTDDELSVPPQLTESTNYRRPQVRFGILPHGRHEHNLIHIRTEATITDTLRTLISEKWKKRQSQRAEEGERDGYKGEPCAHEKYGSGNKSIGYGRSGNVRLSRKATVNNYAVECFAIKEYRRGTRETIKAYRNRSTLSFCISSCLRHTNVIDVLDIVQEPNGNYCEVMALCDGGNLATIILRSKKLGAPEADCFFKQLVCGVEYLHSVGVAHRDLKPDNLLLTSKGVLKIADFGEAECFRFPWEQEARMSSGRCGTTPYLAPELFLDGEYDSRLVDVWAMGMIYMAMRTGNILWSAALRSHGGTYARYLSDRKLHSGFRPIERLSNVGHISSTVVVK